MQIQLQTAPRLQESSPHVDVSFRNHSGSGHCNQRTVQYSTAWYCTICTADNRQEQNQTLRSYGINHTGMCIAYCIPPLSFMQHGSRKDVLHPARSWSMSHEYMFPTLYPYGMNHRFTHLLSFIQHESCARIICLPFIRVESTRTSPPIPIDVA